MQFGVQTVQQNCAIATLIDLWRLLDTLGFYRITVNDHLIGVPSVAAHESVFESLVSLTTLAAVTTHVRVGCFAFCMSHRHPSVLAKSLMTLDHVSRGRLDIGLGAGWNEPACAAYGIPFLPLKERFAAFEEGIEVIRRLLTQERPSYRGRYVSLAEAVCHPTSLQVPIPLWICGNGERRTIPMAATYGDGWNSSFTSPEVFSHKNALLSQASEGAGRNPDHIVRSVNLGFFMATDGKREQAIETDMEGIWGSRLPSRRAGFLTGRKDRVIERIGAYLDAGAEQINLVVRAPFDAESLQQFAEEVIPAFPTAA